MPNIQWDTSFKSKIFATTPDFSESVDLQAEVQSVKDLVFNGIYKHSNNTYKESEPKGLLLNITNYSDDIVMASLGKFGLNLKYFAQSVDLKHPDLFEFVRGLSTGKIAERLDNILQIAEYAKDIGASSILDYFVNYYEKILSSNYLLNNIVSNPPIRLIKDANLRNQARSMIDNNTSVQIDINNEHDWHAQPETMQAYARFNTYKDKDVDRKITIKNYFSQMGLSSLTQRLGAKINLLQSAKNEQFCGFYRISLESAAVTLAKMHGFVFHQLSGDIVVPADTNKKFFLFLGNLLVPNNNLVAVIRQYFSSDMKLQGILSIRDCIEKLASEDIGTSEELVINDLLFRFFRKYSKQFHFNYQARVYPLDFVRSMLSSKMNEMMERLEQWPEMTGRPLFDKYLVVVPSIKLNPGYFADTCNSSYSFKDKDIVHFDSLTSSYTYLDKKMIEKDIVKPIIVGQVGDKYYFVNYI